MREHSRVSIVVDSAASLPDVSEYVSEGELYVVPMRLTMNGRTFLDKYELEPTAFYANMRVTDEKISTSGPTPSDFLKSFQYASKNSSEILCITVSQNFSSSFHSANLAAREAKIKLPNTTITVLDSQSAAGGQGLVVTGSLRAAKKSHPRLAEITKAANGIIEKVTLLAFLDNLYHVWRSGRVPRLAYLGASILGVKPLLEMFRGDTKSIGRPRSRSKASQNILTIMKRRVGDNPVHVTVMHADALQEAEHLCEFINSNFQCGELYISEFSAVMGAHTGPGLLGVAFWTGT